ncbi:MAG: quinohemoprotein amine dehydrogenase subunit alpha [Desulfuromonadales bacterium]
MLKTVCLSLVLLFLTIGTVPEARAFSNESLVWKKCTGCHEPVNGKIARVEEIRTTPEEWTVIVDRMSRLYGMELTRKDMDTLLKELCSTQILSPAELDKVSYLNLLNNPQTVENPIGAEQEKMFTTCVRCHSAGKINSYRMNAPSWAKVRDLHLSLYPTVVYQMREMRWTKEAETVLAALVKSHPYGQAWQAPTAKPDGSWLILGYEPGKGNYRGQATITSGSNDEYTVQGKLDFADNTSENFRGEATLYGGYALRTRTAHNGQKTLGAFSFTDGIIQGEHHFPAPDFRTSSSTWYPVDGAPKLLRVSPAYLLKGEKTTLVLEGVKLPAASAGDITFSGGAVKVLSVRRISPEALEVVAVSSANSLVTASIGIKGINTVPVTLAKQIDFISITPEMGRARLAGGKAFPAEGVQFDAIAYAKKGKSAKPQDAVRLGPVPAAFKLTAEIKRPNDDDLQWMGMISPGGKYLPFGDIGSIATRSQHVEATGLAKVEATYKRGARQYLAKARMVVTLPDMIPRIK